MPSLQPPSRRALRISDAGVVVFVFICVGMGIWVFNEIRDVRSLSNTLATTGRGLERAGMALEGAPSVIGGDKIAQLGEDARTAGRQAQASAREGRDSIDTVSILAGLAIGLIPTMAVLLLYVPMRMALRAPP